MAATQAPPAFLQRPRTRRARSASLKIKRRALRWWWKIDPTFSGSTIALKSHDLARACAWLRDIAKVEPDALTPRAFDQCLWAAALVLSRRYDQETALLKVKRALQADELWRSKTGQVA